MNTTESKHIARSVGIVVALVVTTVVAAGVPIMLAQHRESDRPVPAGTIIEQTLDER